MDVPSRVPPIKIPCPTCGAQPDENCVRTVSRLPMDHFHWGREGYPYGPRSA